MRNDNVKCTQSVLVKVQDLKKYFDVSPSLLTRVVERKPRALLKATPKTLNRATGVILVVLGIVVMAFSILN